MTAKEDMPGATFEWKRRWRQWRAQPSGLSPMETIETYESIDKHPVLVLWGEPGLGKTYEMTRAYKALGPELAEFISLRLVTRAEDLQQALHGSASFRAWQRMDEGTWTLFLDGFDEAAVPSDLLGEWLCGALRSIKGSESKTRRARIRITTRIQSWSGVVAFDLNEVWGWQAVATYELEPLTMEEVGQSLHASRLLEQVERIGLTEFAQRPLGLQILLAVIAQTDDLPTSAIDVLEAFLVPIAECSRKTSLALLGRVATASLLGGRARIWVGARGRARPDDAIDVEELASGSEFVDGQPVDIARSDIRHAVGSGPFTALNGNLFEWKHQTFVEFLAARWLSTHVDRASVLLERLSYTQDGRQWIHPHLRELARWIAALNEEFRRALIDVDNDILFYSHPAIASNRDRQKVLETLLTQFASSDQYTPSNHPNLSFDQFRHPTIDAQLRPYLLPSAASNAVRGFAVDIAAACDLKVLTPELLGIVQEDAGVDHLRYSAVRAIGRIGTSADMVLLAKILTDGPSNDPRGAVRGALLSLLWPSFLSHRQLFAAIDPSREAEAWGYSDFLVKLNPRFDTAAEAMIGLEWVSKLPADCSQTYKIAAGQVVCAAFPLAHVESVGDVIAALYVDYAKAQANVSESITGTIDELYRQIPWEGRRAIVSTALKATFSTHADLLKSRRPWTLVTFDDIDDLVRDAPILQAETSSAATATVIAIALAQRPRERTPEEIANANIKEVDCPEILRILKTIRSAGRSKVGTKPMAGDAEEWHAKVYDMAEAIVKDANRWCDLDLALIETSTSEFKPSLSMTPGWKALSKTYHAPVVSYARHYLEMGTLTEASWLGTRAWHRPAAAAYRAFRLLAEFPSEFASLPTAAWKKWASAIVGLSWQGSNEELEIQAMIANACSRHARQEQLEAVCRVIDEGNYPAGFDLVLAVSLHPNDYDTIWNCIRRAFQLGRWKGDEMSLRVVEVLARSLCRGFRAFAKEQLQSQDDAGSENGGLSFGDTIGALFFLHDRPSAWPFFARKIALAPEQGRRMLAWAAERSWRDNEFLFLDELSEEMLADLCEWTLQWRAAKGSTSVTYDRLDELFRSTLRSLTKKYSYPSAIAQLERLRKAFPEEAKLRVRAKKARVHPRHWQHLAPREVLALSNVN